MEQAFEEFRGEWERLATIARREITAGHRGNAADPWPATTRRAVAELMVEIGREVGMRAADFAVTSWLILPDEPITATVAAAAAEDRPYEHGGPRTDGPFAETLREVLAAAGPAAVGRGQLVRPRPPGR